MFDLLNSIPFHLSLLSLSYDALIFRSVTLPLFLWIFSIHPFIVLLYRNTLYLLFSYFSFYLMVIQSCTRNSFYSFSSLFLVWNGWDCCLSMHARPGKSRVNMPMSVLFVGSFFLSSFFVPFLSGWLPGRVCVCLCLCSCLCIHASEGEKMDFITFLNRFLVQ